MREYKSWQWFLITGISFLYQILGNTSIPEFKNSGILIAVLFVCLILMSNEMDKPLFEKRGER